ncbi:TPA: hypothetical protein OW829_003636 [Escherichia coli]|nr:hypothetical protein [Escherichia coli]HCW1305408.1 hypothetical protein [Escherichia coli]
MPVTTSHALSAILAQCLGLQTTLSFPRPEWLMLSTTFNGWLLLLRG